MLKKGKRGEVMTPGEFFESAAAGSHIRYDKGNCISVRITYISRLGEYAYGREAGTNRLVYLVLCNGMLKDCARGCFGCVELSK